MSDAVGMGQQDRAERDKFENELKRILEASEKAGVVLRVIGSLAFQMHCPKYGRLQREMGRAYTDIDFGALTRGMITSLAENPNFQMLLSHPVRSLKQDKHGRWWAGRSDGQRIRRDG